MTCPTQLADAWRQRSGNDQARLIENHGPRRRAVPSPHRVTESGPVYVFGAARFHGFTPKSGKLGAESRR